MLIIANKRIPDGNRVVEWKEVFFNIPNFFYSPNGAITRETPAKYNAEVQSMIARYRENTEYFRNVTVNFADRRFSAERADEHFETTVSSLEELHELLARITEMYPNDVVEISTEDPDRFVLLITFPD